MSGWKQQFTAGEVLTLKGVDFVIANVGKRGLALRRANAGDMGLALRESLLRGGPVVGREPHKLAVAGSIPAPATNLAEVAA